MLYNVDMCKKGGVILARKLCCDISPTCYKISEKKEILLRNIKDFFSKEKFANERLKEELPNIVKSHTSILIRKLHGVDIKLQENKVTNITFLTKAEDKVLSVACSSLISRYIFIKEINKRLAIASLF